MENETREQVAKRLYREMSTNLFRTTDRRQDLGRMRDGCKFDLRKAAEEMTEDQPDWAQEARRDPAAFGMWVLQVMGVVSTSAYFHHAFDGWLLLYFPAEGRKEVIDGKEYWTGGPRKIAHIRPNITSILVRFLLEAVEGDDLDLKNKRLQDLREAAESVLADLVEVEPGCYLSPSHRNVHGDQELTLGKAGKDGWKPVKSEGI